MAIENKYGSLTGWNDVVFNFAGTDIDGVTAIKYEETQEIENHFGAGAVAIGQSKGNREASGSFTVLLEDSIAMQKSLPKGAKIQDVVSTIIVAYDVSGNVLKDRINNVRIKNNGREVNQGDGKISISYEFIATSVDFDI